MAATQIQSQLTGAMAGIASAAALLSHRVERRQWADRRLLLLLCACSYEEDLSTSLAAEDNRPRILLMGTRRSGKSSIQKVVFHKMVSSRMATAIAARADLKCWRHAHMRSSPACSLSVSS